MNEEIELKNSLIKHMTLNILSFAMILSIFALFMFFIMKTVTYSNIDEELVNAKDELLRIAALGESHSNHPIATSIVNAYENLE